MWPQLHTFSIPAEANGKPIYLLGSWYQRGTLSNNDRIVFNDGVCRSKLLVDDVLDVLQAWLCSTMRTHGASLQVFTGLQSECVVECESIAINCVRSITPPINRIESPRIIRALYVPTYRLLVYVGYRL